MQSSRRRHLEYLIEHKVRPGARRRPRLLAAGVEPILPPEFNWRDYAIHLLHVAAGVVCKFHFFQSSILTLGTYLRVPATSSAASERIVSRPP